MERAMKQLDKMFPPYDFDSLNIGRRLSLLDPQKKLIAGVLHTTGKESLLTLHSGNKVIGYLALKRRLPKQKSLETDFLREQTFLLIGLGSGVLLLTGMLAYALSRGIVGRIRRLRLTTNALAERKLDVRIPESRIGSDELGDLAHDFNSLAETIENYERMRKQWIVDISHELRTPLAILRGEIEAVLDGVRELNRGSLVSLHAEVMRLIRLVNDLHELSLADAKGGSKELKDLFPASAAEETVAVFRNRLEEAGLQISVALEQVADIPCRVDHDQLCRVFANILENALRYVHKPGIIMLAGNYTEKWLEIDYQDSGPGVPEASLPLLFDRLYRVDKSRSRSLGGSGLGLAICRELIKAMGGDITADTAPLGGLRIIIRLPRYI